MKRLMAFAMTAAVITFVIMQATVIAQAPTADGIWISRTDLLALPMSGAAWDHLVQESSIPCGIPDITNQDDETNTCVMGKALLAARTGDVAQRDEVIDALEVIADGPVYQGRALALGRELAAYVIAADLIDLRAQDPALDQRFRDRIRTLVTTPTILGPKNLIDCHESRANNWGAHCGASRIAVAMYLGDQVELARATQVFKGFLGDRAAYTGFEFGDDLTWQCDPGFPVPINPVGCLKDGHSIDGVVPDDQRRAGPFIWPPPMENYVGSSRVDLQACKLEYSIVSPK